MDMVAIFLKSSNVYRPIKFWQMMIRCSFCVFLILLLLYSFKIPASCSFLIPCRKYSQFTPKSDSNHFKVQTEFKGFISWLLASCDLLFRRFENQIKVKWHNHIPPKLNILHVAGRPLWSLHFTANFRLDFSESS